MHKYKRILALIIARGGSKGLPGKNLRLLDGRPLLAWAIKQARDSRYIDSVVISTDDKKIAAISKKYGAEVPFLRPEELATDEATGIDVVLHAINWINEHSRPYDIVVLLQPTSPLRLSGDIDKAIKLLFSKKASAIVSVCEADQPPCWLNTLPEDGCMKDFMKRKVSTKNRQDMPVYHKINGAIYLGYSDYIEKQKGFFGNKTFAYIMPRERSIDIDYEIDFEFAEFIMRKKSCKTLLGT